jgi:aryl-alcohol dehydrogenase
MKIKAAVVREKAGPFFIEELNLSEPRQDEVIVKMVGAGICHTDLIARDQYIPVPLPAVFGHEGSGTVEEVGRGVTRVQPGDHVVLSFNSCGNCLNCARSMPGYCLNIRHSFTGARPDGSTTLSKDGEVVRGSFIGQSSFGTFALVNERNVVKVSQKLPLKILGPLGCGIQTGAGAVINSLAVRAGSSIAIFGVGAVGMSALMAARVVGCTTIIAVDIKSNRLRIAQEFGATHVINSTLLNPVETIYQITGTGVNYAVDTTGRPTVLRAAVEALMVTGVCGLVGAATTEQEVTLNMTNIVVGRTLRGIMEGDSIPTVFIPQLIELYQQGHFPFDKLIKFYPLEDINQAVYDTESGEVFKPVLVFD